MEYKFRGLPCTILSNDKLWCVTGGRKTKDGDGGGVWCYDKEDAEYLMNLMAQDPSFYSLGVKKWQE